MDAAIDAEREILARTRLLNALHVLDDTTEPVLDDALAARIAAQPVVIGQLQALLADVIDVREAHHVGTHFARGIVTAVFALQRDAGHIQGHDRRGPLRIDAPLEVDKGFVPTFRKQALDATRLKFKQLGQLSLLRQCRVELLRINPHGIDRRADGERFTVAIGDHAAMRGHGHHAQIACVTLFLQEISMKHVQIDAPPQQHQQPDGQRRVNDNQTPGGDGLWNGVAHGLTITTSCGAGMRISSSLRATCSIRPCVAQVLCSSCSCPHSTFMASRS